MYTAPRWSFSKGAPIATSLKLSRFRSLTAAMAVPKRAPQGSFSFRHLSERAVQQDWLTGFNVNWCSNWPFWFRKRRERMRASPGSLPTGPRPRLYLTEFVDVDLPLLVSLCAHEHRSSDQEEICEGVVVDVQRLQHAAEVGPDLAERPDRLRALLRGR